VAGVPLYLTFVVPVKAVPVMVTIGPGAPEVGLKVFTAGFTLKSVLLHAMAVLVRTEIGPVRAPVGTVAAIWESESTLKVAPTPSKYTASAPVRCSPVMVTPLPTGAAVGFVEAMAGNPWSGSYSSAEDRS